MPVAAQSPTMDALRTPPNDGDSLVWPAWEQAPELLAENQALLRDSDATDSISILETPLAELAYAAKTEIRKLAIGYMQTFAPLDQNTLASAESQETPVVLSGHQPALFHPGVWFKNFALHRLAKESNAVGIHLLIDNDLVHAPSIATVRGSREQPSSVQIAMDVATSSAVPYEELQVQDMATFESFGSRVAEAVAPFIENPIIKRMWKSAVEATATTQNLGECLSHARRKLEREHRVANLEVPLSRVCDGDAFAQFFAHLLLNAKSFHDAYNLAIRDYRVARKLRSQSHPAPLLQRVNDKNGSGVWFELPFWAWSSDAPERQPLYLWSPNDDAAQRSQDGSRYRLMSGVPTTVTREFELPKALAGGPSLASFRQAMNNETIKIRPRALVTTLFARLFLSDLFLHGIGGAKYDVVTDNIMQHFYGITAPHYMALSATFRLPVTRPHVEQDDVRQISGLLRELAFHPEKVDNASSEFTRLQSEKRALLNAMPPKGERLDWHQQVVAVNQRLYEFHTPWREQLLAERKRLAQQLRNQRLLAAREFSFCLFPEQQLATALLQLAQC